MVLDYSGHSVQSELEGILVEAVRMARGVLQESNTEMVTFWTKAIMMGRERTDLILELVSR